MGKEESEGLTCQALPGNLELGFQTGSLGGSFKSPGRAGGSDAGEEARLPAAQTCRPPPKWPFSKAPICSVAESLGFSGRKGTELGSRGGMAGAVHVDPPPPPLHSKQTPLPLLLQRGEKILIQNPDGESSRKEGFSRCHVSPLHGSVRRNLECGVYVCAGGRWRPASSPRTLNACWWLLGSGTWGQSRPGAREVFELPQPTSRAPQRRGGTPSPSDLEMRASVRFASAHVCQRRSREAAWPPGRLAARRGVQVRRTEDRPTAGPAQRHRG